MLVLLLAIATSFACPRPEGCFVVPFAPELQMELVQGRPTMGALEDGAVWLTAGNGWEAAPPLPAERTSARLVMMSALGRDPSETLATFRVHLEGGPPLAGPSHAVRHVRAFAPAGSR